jgi:hypothetical protein
MLLATRLAIGLTEAEQQEYADLCQQEWALLQASRRVAQHLDLREDPPVGLDGADDDARLPDETRRQ